jgi:hypothetical protein
MNELIIWPNSPVKTHDKNRNMTSTIKCIERVILLGDQQDGGKKRQISTPVSVFSAIVGVSLKCVL